MIGNCRPHKQGRCARRVRRVGSGETFAVYRLGGGRFETAVLRCEHGQFVQLGQPVGSDDLGGVRFDQTIFEHVLGAIGSPLERVRTPELEVALTRLFRDCVKAKELLAETVAAMWRARRSVGVTAEDLSSVLLAGGSSQIPLVRRLLSTEFGCRVVDDPHPGQSIAMGAAETTTAMLNADVFEASVEDLPAPSPRSAGRLDDDVQFTVYRPARLPPETWGSVLFCVRKSAFVDDPVRGSIDPLKEVEARAEAHFRGESVRARTVDAKQPLAYGTSLRIVPPVAGRQMRPRGCRNRLE
jgi:hypothetical protein